MNDQSALPLEEKIKRHAESSGIANVDYNVGYNHPFAVRFYTGLQHESLVTNLSRYMRYQQRGKNWDDYAKETFSDFLEPQKSKLLAGICIENTRVKSIQGQLKISDDEFSSFFGMDPKMAIALVRGNLDRTYRAYSVVHELVHARDEMIGVDYRATGLDIGVYEIMTDLRSFGVILSSVPGLFHDLLCYSGSGGYFSAYGAREVLLDAIRTDLRDKKHNIAWLENIRKNFPFNKNPDIHFWFINSRPLSDGFQYKDVCKAVEDKLDEVIEAEKRSDVPQVIPFDVNRSDWEGEFEKPL